MQGRVIAAAVAIGDARSTWVRPAIILIASSPHSLGSVLVPTFGAVSVIHLSQAKPLEA